MGKITKREQEILILLADGLTNKDISEILYISIDTVKSHRNNLLVKFCAKNTPHLISKAYKNSMIKL